MSMFAVEVPARTKMVRYKHRPVSFVESGWGAYYAPFPIELINIVTFDTLRCTIFYIYNFAEYVNNCALFWSLFRCVSTSWLQMNNRSGLTTALRASYQVCECCSNVRNLF